MSDTIKYFLEESKMPKTWYNIAADLSIYKQTRKIARAHISVENYTTTFPTHLHRLQRQSPSGSSSTER